MTVARRDALVLLAALAAGPTSAAAQTAADARAFEAAATQDILQLRDRIRAAIAARDRKMLEPLYADGFVHIRDSGRTDLKNERIALLISGEPTIETVPEENLEVKIFGPTTAVATGLATIKDAGSGRSAVFRWLTVYAKDASGWRVAVSQASRTRRRR